MLDICNCKNGWLYDYRRDGEIIEIPKSEKQENDIWIGQILHYKINRPTTKIEIIKNEEGKNVEKEVIKDNILIVKEKQKNDIVLENIITDRILICRGGNTIKAINFKNKKEGDIEEYKYLSYELEEVGKEVKYNEEMAKEYIIEKFIEPKLERKYLTTKNMILNANKAKQDYENELKEIKEKTYKEIKKIL
jgi:hypothetical protein